MTQWYEMEVIVFLFHMFRLYKLTHFVNSALGKRRNSEDYEENRISKKCQNRYIIPPPRPNSKPDSDTEDYEEVSVHEVQVSEKEILARRVGTLIFFLLLYLFLLT